MPSARPSPSMRKFNSAAVEEKINSLLPRFASQNLATLFSNTLPNTLDTTVFFHSQGSPPTLQPDTFIVTGDIEAMWQRDSTNQVWPYLPFLQSDTALRSLVAGLIQRQASNILWQPYANAYQIDNSKAGPHSSDVSIPKGAASANRTFEYKWELDSLANCLRLSAAYFAYTGDKSPYDASWLASVQIILSTMREQQKGSEEEDIGGGPAYGFQRNTQEPSDSLEHMRGPVAKRTGMIKCAFRGSDDALVLPFNIPENAFAAVALENATSLLRILGHATEADEAAQLAEEIRTGILQFGIMLHPLTKTRVFAYEVDGFGSQYFMDDANIPGLLSMPYYNFLVKEDPLYQSTRSALLSSSTNPYYMCGRAACGIGGPHNGWPWVWPMAIISQAWTSMTDAEISLNLEVLVNSSACTGFIHESFNKDNVTQYTRHWFAWANSLFGDLILKLAIEKPSLIFK